MRYKLLLTVFVQREKKPVCLIGKGRTFQALQEHQQRLGTDRDGGEQDD